MAFELDIIRWLQSIRTDLLDSFFKLVTLLGEELILIVLLGFIYWSVNKKIGEKIGFTVFISLTLNSILKLVIHRPRPFMVDSSIENLKPESAGGYSFPSGHTQTAATSFFSLYYFLKKNWLLIVAIIITVLVAISRMYLGVHYLSDVVFGAILGILIAWLMSKYFDLIKHIDKVYKVLLALSLLAVLVVVIVNYLGNMTENGLDAAQFYFDSEAVLKMLGTVAGFIIGVNFEKQHVNFENHRTLWKNLVRFGLGIAVILAVRYGAKALFGLIVDSEELVVGEAFAGITAVMLDFVRYLLILFVGIGLYPKLFKLINI